MDVINSKESIKFIGDYIDQKTSEVLATLLCNIAFFDGSKDDRTATVLKISTGNS